MSTAANLEPEGGVTAWHAVAADEVVQRLNSNTRSGLDPAEVARRLEKYGPQPTAGRQRSRGRSCASCCSSTTSSSMSCSAPASSS